MYILSDKLAFPSPHLTDESGLLAIGGDLSVERLLLAYKNGIFPWFDDSQPILWWSPDPRMVLFPDELKVSKSMRQVIRSNRFQVTVNKNFTAVIQACSTTPRKGQSGTWITNDMQKAYSVLHQQGHAHSVEVWAANKLVGGLYGIWLKEKNIFCGESMFSHQSNASKFGFIYWVNYLASKGVKLIDCQLHTPHLESLGAKEIPREVFLSYLIESSDET